MPSVKSWDKNHIKGGQNWCSTVICSTEYEQSDWESIRRSFQSVWSYEEIRGAFDSNGGRRPQRDPPQRRWTATVRHLVCINIRCMSLDGGDRNGDWHRNTSTMVEVVWRHKSTSLWARSAACIRSLAKLSLVTFSVAEPANWL